MHSANLEETLVHVFELFAVDLALEVNIVFERLNLDNHPLSRITTTTHLKMSLPQA